MSVLELHPESAPFVGKLFDTKLPRIGIFGESPYLPENKGSSFTREDYYSKSSDELGFSSIDKAYLNTSQIVQNDIIEGVIANKSHSIYKNLGNDIGKALGSGDYRATLSHTIITNGYDRPAEITGESINNNEMDDDYAYDKYIETCEKYRLQIPIISSYKLGKTIERVAKKRGDKKGLKWLEKSFILPHASTAHYARIRNYFIRKIRIRRIKLLLFSFFKRSLYIVILLLILLLAFLLFRNCSFESQQEPAIQTVAESKVAEPTKEFWNTEKVTAVKSSLNGCETLTNAANFKTEWEKNLENAKINEAKQIVIPSVGVLFELGSSVVSEEGRKLIQEFASAYLQTNKEVTVLIESYTCDIGTDENNMTLSNDRANVIKAVLENMGVTSVEVKSYGESTYNDLSCKSKEEHRRGNISVK